MYKQSEQPDTPKSEQQEEQQLQPENQYGSAQYWQTRYKKTKGQRFDWLQSSQPILHILQSQLGLSKTLTILNIGCGNGQLQDQLYNEGYHNIYNNDISKQVIKQMQQIKIIKQQHMMIYHVMDVREMSYHDCMFDVVVDKSTIDALLCGRQPYVDTARMVEEVWRVLKPGGLYLVVSYAGPENRMKHLTRQHINFDIKVEQLVRTNENGMKLTHYAYICRKKQKNKEAENVEWRKQFYEKIKLEEQQDYGQAQ